MSSLVFSFTGRFKLKKLEKKAQQLNLTGWVEDLSSKRSKGVVFGAEQTIEKFSEFLYLGSLSGDLSELEMEWGEYEYEGDDFRVVA